MADRTIDPRFYMPPVEGFEYRENELGVEEAPSEAQDITYVEFAGDGLQPPSDFRVVDQIIRKGLDGKTVVDLVLEVEDMPGATEYDVRTASV